MGLMDVLKTDKEIKEATDSIGGFSILESGIYPMKVKLAFITLSAGKAMALNIHFEGLKKELLRAQFYMTSGEAKGCKNFYINKKTQEKHYLPGFNQANALCLLTVGKEVAAMDTATKSIMLYDPMQQQEVPTDVDFIEDLVGKDVYAGVINQLVDKRAKNKDTGQYEPTGETRKENEVDKFFRAKDKLTVVEIKAKATEPIFFNKWKENWEGKTKDKTTKASTTKGVPKRETGKQAPQENLFT